MIEPVIKLRQSSRVARAIDRRDPTLVAARMGHPRQAGLGNGDLMSGVWVSEICDLKSAIISGSIEETLAHE